MASTQHATQLGDNIRAHRRALGMSQEELARACYVSRPSISNWECGKTQPSAEDLACLPPLSTSRQMNSSGMWHPLRIAPRPTGAS